jgi:hypothetical protein
VSLYSRLLVSLETDFEVVLERGPLNLVSTIEELLGRNRDYGRGDSLR